MVQKLQKWGYGLVAMAPVSAFAAVDVSDITNLATDIGTIGVAILGIYIAIKGIKLIRRAL
jgi:hypothetical protein